MSELAEVRRAYRSIVAYERRVLEAVGRVDDLVREAGFERRALGRGGPAERGSPGREWPGTKWAWDHVPLFAARFQWLAGGENAAGSRYVVVDHVADTAYERKRLEERTLTEPDMLEDLEAVAEEASRSVLRWNVVKLGAPVPANVWRSSWNDVFAKTFGATVETFTTLADGAAARHTSAGLELVRGGVDLSAVDSAVELEARLLAPLRAELGA